MRGRSLVWLLSGLVACDDASGIEDPHPWRMFSGCLPGGGGLSICEDPLTGTSPQAEVVGGTFLPDGFRIDEKGDRITFDLGADASAGTVRFTLSGIGPVSLDEDTLVLLLATDTPELKDPEPTRVLELKLWGGAVDPTQAGNTRFGAGDTTQEAVKSAGVLNYETAQTYEFEVSWNDATQRLTLAKDGEELLDFQTGDLIPGPNNAPIALRYRYVHLAMPFLAHPAFWPIIDGVYGSVSITADVPDAGAAGSSGDDAGDAPDPDVDVTSAAMDTGEPDPDADPDASASASSESGDATSSTSDGGDGSDDANALPFPQDRGDDSNGCACTTDGEPPRASALLALLVFGLRRRVTSGGTSPATRR